MSANNALNSISNKNGSGTKQSASVIVILNKASKIDAMTKKIESSSSLVEDKRVEKQAIKSPSKDRSLKLDAASSNKLSNQKKKSEDSSHNNNFVQHSTNRSSNVGATFASSDSTKSRQEGVQGFTISKSSSAASSSYLDKARQASPASKSKPSKSSTSQVPVTIKKKYRPTETLELDLLTLALQAKKDEEARKQHHQARQFHNRSSGAAAAAAAAREKDGELGEKKIGKVRGAGEILRRKNRLSSLKKRILQERKVRWWLLHPDVQSFPLVSHPALIEHECIWLNQSRVAFDEATSKEESDLDGDEEEDENDDEEEEDSRGEQANEEDEESLDHEEDDDEEQEEDESDEDRASKEGELANNNNEKDSDGELNQNNNKAGNLHRAATGSIPFDPLLASPIYFGAFYRRLPPNTGSSSLADNSNNIQGKTKKDLLPRPLPNARPVRDYVTQALSKQLDDLCLQMLAKLFKYQERARVEDPVNAKLRRRLVMGLHEVRRGVRSNRCIAVVVVPNVEDSEGLDEKLQEILSLCSAKQEDDLWRPVPIIFASNKRHLGRALGKRAAVSCVGIYSADGAHEQFRQCLKMAEKLGGFWKSQVAEEIRMAGLGRRITCASCLSTLEGSVRRDCLNCKRTFCEPCASRMVAKQEPCISHSSDSFSSNKQAMVTCEIVRVARTTPKLAKVSLSIRAKEFVPPVLVSGPDHKTSDSAASPQQASLTSSLVTANAGSVSKTTSKLNAAAEEYKPPTSLSTNSLSGANEQTAVARD